MSTSRNGGRKTPYSDPKCGRHIANWLLRAGPTPSVQSTPMSASIPSGTISETPSHAMPDCASTTCSCLPPWLRAWSRPMSIATFADGRSPVTTPQPGLSSATDIIGLIDETGGEAAEHADGQQRLAPSAEEAVMAVRPYWKGYLKLSLVTCAVSLTPATTQGEKVRFHTLNRKTGERIHTQYVDAVTGKVVDEDDRTKAYEKGEDDYVILEEEDLDSVQLESTRTIDIDQFVEADTIEWVYYDS